MWKEVRGCPLKVLGKKTKKCDLDRRTGCPSKILGKKTKKCDLDGCIGDICR
jgi:hypothetical protein